MHSPPGVCDAYDSMVSCLSPTLSRQIAVIMRCPEPYFKVRFINVQRQSGASDCGLFALDFAVALCKRQDPHQWTFEQTKMRKHLMQCLENGKVTEFPVAKPRRFTSAIKFIRNVNVYCTCRLPWDKELNTHGDLAQCNTCRKWFHQKCMSVPLSAFVDSSSSWFCTTCV